MEEESSQHLNPQMTNKSTIIRQTQSALVRRPLKSHHTLIRKQKHNVTFQEKNNGIENTYLDYLERISQNISNYKQDLSLLSNELAKIKNQFGTIPIYYKLKLKRRNLFKNNFGRYLYKTNIPNTSRKINIFVKQRKSILTSHNSNQNQIIIPQVLNILTVQHSKKKVNIINNNIPFKNQKIINKTFESARKTQKQKESIQIKNKNHKIHENDIKQKSALASNVDLLKVNRLKSEFCIYPLQKKKDSNLNRIYKWNLNIIEKSLRIIEKNYRKSK